MERWDDRPVKLEFLEGLAESQQVLAHLIPYHTVPQDSTLYHTTCTLSYCTVPYYATSYHTILHEENLLVKLKSRLAESEKVFSKLDLKYQMRKIR